MKIEPLSPNEVPLLGNLQPEGWGNILPSFEMYTVRPWCFPMKVIVNGNIAGIGTAIIHKKIAWLAHIIVHPAERNKGIGLFITKYLVELCHAKNCDTICLIATDLGAPVYEKVGFVTETEYLMFRDIKPVHDYQIAGNIIPNHGEFDAEILQLDYQLMGEDRSMELQPHLRSAYLFFADEYIQGFYLPSLGEGLIVASNNIAGVELVKLRMSTKDNAAFPEHNQFLKHFYISNGFTASRKTKRMTLGKAVAWKQNCLFNRVGGNLG